MDRLSEIDSYGQVSSTKVCQQPPNIHWVFNILQMVLAECLVDHLTAVVNRSDQKCSDLIFQVVICEEESWYTVFFGVFYICVHYCTLLQQAIQYSELGVECFAF
jgi:hypothetical protein